MKIQKTSFALLAIVAGVTLTLVSCVSPLSWSRYGNSLDALSADAWKADVAALEQELIAHHPKLATDSVAAGAVRKAAQTAMGSIDSAIAATDRRDAAIAGIAEICAAVGDGHTRVNASPEAQYPVALRFFPTSDDYATTEFELRVYAVMLPGAGAETPSYAAALGKKVDSIGGFSVPDALAMLAPALSVESKLEGSGLERVKEEALRAESLNALMNPMLMRGIGLADHEGLKIVAESSLYSIPEMTREEASGSGWSYAIDPAAPTAVFRQYPETEIWHTVLDDAPDTLYMAFRSCPSDAGTAFDDVLRKIAENASISRLIVDMRANSGGDSRPGSAFARSLGSTALAKKRGGVVVLVGPYTFSSALMNAADILKACGAKGDPDSGNAILAGEPMIEPIDHYGEMYRFSLKNSGLVIGRSKKFWKYSATSGIDPATGFLSPQKDWMRAATYDEYRRGADSVLELVLSK